MRAAIIKERGAAPVIADFPEPQAKEGAVLIDVDTAGLGGWDVLGAYRMGVEYPCVIRGEGVGRRVGDGRRVYSGKCPTTSTTSWPSPWELPVPARSFRLKKRGFRRAITC